MKYEDILKEQLIQEVRNLRNRLAELEQSIIKDKQFRKEIRSLEERIAMLEGPEEKKQLPDNANCGSETVLVVEDNERVRSLVTKILDRYGYGTLKANNAEEALKIVKRHDGPIDLLLTDIMLPPGVDGHELVVRIRRLKPKIKVLYMSGYADGAIMPQEVFDVLGSCENFLQKPFSHESLARSVRQELDRTYQNN